MGPGSLGTELKQDSLGSTCSQEGLSPLMISPPFSRLDYPSLRQSAYLNQASLGLISQPAVTAMHSFIDNVARHGNLHMSDSDEVAYCETVRERASQLLHCDSSRVAIVASASEILGQLPMFASAKTKEHNSGRCIRLSCDNSAVASSGCSKKPYGALC